jgi:hypothetical protein
MITCPKCRAKGTSVYLLELWKNHSIEFSQEEDGSLIGSNQSEGDPYKVVGICRKCEHVWTLRGARQITDLEEN